MATFKSDEIANLDVTTKAVNLHQRVAGPSLFPRKRTIISTYTMVGTEAQNDVVCLAPLYQGETVLSHQSLVTSDGIATTATVDIGDDDPTADPDRYADGINVAAAGYDLFNANSAAAATAPRAVGTDCWLKLLFATLVTPVAGKKLRIITEVVGA
jgi:hypothetical protein